MSFNNIGSQERSGRRFTVGKIAAWTIGGVALATVFAFLFGWLVQYLWNNTLVPIFSIAAITYWQAVGLLILARLLVGGLGHKHEGPPQYIRQKFHNKIHGKPFEHGLAGDMRDHYHRFWEEKGEQALKEYLDEKLDKGSEKE
ncbi:hypothetical protein ACFL5S_02035 [Fibrobacterota bacterium]